MSVYVDKTKEYPTTFRYKRFCHMWADNVEELHAFAGSLGLRRAWFQPFPKHRLAHYDIVPTKRALAVKLGAIQRDIVKADFVRAREQGATPMWPEPKWEVTTIEIHMANFWGSACGTGSSSRTANPGQVTCGTCRNSYWFKMANANPHNFLNQYVEGQTQIIYRDMVPWLPPKGKMYLS